MRTEQLVGRRAAGHELVYQSYRLSVVEGPDKGKKTVGDGEETTIGTDQGANLCLTDRAVSKHHATILSTEEGLELRDLGSKNGTIVGGHRVKVAFVQPGSLISCGRNLLRIDATGVDHREPLSPRQCFGAAVGASPAIRRVFAQLERFAPTESTVLLEGETGTGKEVLARAIHDASPRADKPFVIVDLGALSPTLIASELFGHARGAFTGALDSRIGALESAQGGTLFLDEIGEMPLELQPLLLRGLEDRSIQRVGSSSRIPIDIRVVAATNRDLRAEVNSGRFRADLYFRLAVLRVTVPPLRARREDIPLLVRQFAQEFGERGFSTPLEHSAIEDLVTALSTRSWPGNVRELRSAVERATIVGGELSYTDDPVARDDMYDLNCAYGEAKERAIASWELEYIRRLLASSGGNLARAARTVNMSRSYLSKLASLYGLRD